MARVLIVDDEAESLLLAELSLRRAGHEVVVCGQPRRVASLLEGEPFEVIVLDVTMPELSGFELLRDLKERRETRDVPVLFLSSLAETEDRVRGLRLGAADYLGKPFDPEEFALRVERLASTAPRSGELLGDLATFPIWELLQSLERSERTGIAHLQGLDESAELHFDRGRLLAAFAGNLTGEDAALLALSFDLGSFRFIEGAVAPSSARDLGVANLLMTSAWLSDELARLAGHLPGLDEPIAMLDGVSPVLPSRLHTPAVERIVDRLLSSGRTTRRVLHDAGIAAPQAVDLLVASFLERGWLCTLGGGAPREASGSSSSAGYVDPLDDAVARFVAASGRTEGSALHVLLLASPARWDEAFSAFRGKLGRGLSERLDAVALRRGGSVPLTLAGREIHLHFQRFDETTVAATKRLLPLLSALDLRFTEDLDVESAGDLIVAANEVDVPIRVVTLPPGSKHQPPVRAGWRIVRRSPVDLTDLFDLLAGEPSELEPLGARSAG